MCLAIMELLRDEMGEGSTPRALLRKMVRAASYRSGEGSSATKPSEHIARRRSMGESPWKPALPDRSHYA
ncbi:MAG: hypothetical protein ACLSHC_04575 [Bilophila wadsworthia]